jgi:hypothetical protein
VSVKGEDLDSEPLLWVRTLQTVEQLRLALLNRVELYKRAVAHRATWLQIPGATTSRLLCRDPTVGGLRTDYLQPSVQQTIDRYRGKVWRNGVSQNSKN